MYQLHPTLGVPNLDKPILGGGPLSVRLKIRLRSKPQRETTIPYHVLTMAHSVIVQLLAFPVLVKSETSVPVALPTLITWPMPIGRSGFLLRQVFVETPDGSGNQLLRGIPAGLGG